MKLTKEEQRIKKSIERGDYKPVSKGERERLESVFKNAATKVARINIRLSGADITKIKLKAEREGIPYQTLIGSILHKFVNDSLVDIEDVQVVKKLLKTG